MSTPVTETVNPENYNLPTAPPACRNVPCIFYAVMNVFILLLGVSGNALVMWISGFKIKKSVNSTWYLSLAVSDFMFCSSLPLGIDHAVKDEWNFGIFMCKFAAFLMYLNWFSSIFLLVIISVDRCVVVMFPVWAQNQRTVRKASVIVILAWIISAVLSFPSFFMLDVKFDDSIQRSICFYSYTDDQQQMAAVVSRFVFLFVIPFLIIIFCYVLILRKLKRNHTVRSNKPFKIMTLLIVAFLICWLPFHTFSLMELNYPEGNSFIELGSLVAIVFANANSCINPFLYAFMGKDFKNQCHALLSKIENAIEEDNQNKAEQTATTTSGENQASSTV